MSSLAFMPRPVVSPSGPAGDVMLTGDVLGHLEVQIVSAQRLLSIVLEQGKAIRARDVPSVVRCAGILQAEIQRRAVIENERAVLLARAGTRLGVPAAGVTLELLTGVMDGPSAGTARERSGQLRGLLAELQREHTINRALMAQELAFLDHLLRLVDADAPVAYNSAGDRDSATPTLHAGRSRVLDLQA